MEIDIIGVHRGDEWLSVFREIFIVVEGLGNLGVLACAHLLSTHIVDELLGGLDTHCLLDLFDELIRIELARVELLKHIVECACGSIGEL